MKLQLKNKFVFLFLMLYSVLASGQTMANEYSHKSYDSVVVFTLNDYSLEPDFNTGNEQGSVIITGSARLIGEDIAIFSQQIRKKESFGESQAMTPVYDIKIVYYKNGKAKEDVKISLFTNNLFASFAIPAQRQGDCMCKGNGGYCCTHGGISPGFKKYLFNLLKKYNLPVESEEYLFTGELISAKKQDTFYSIKAWGSEPFWTLEIHDSVATFQIIDESNVNYNLVQRISNMGFTNESIDTFLFGSETGDTMKLTLVNQQECVCGYDMSDGKSNSIAILFFNTKNIYLQYLGCASIFLR